jgi:adenosine deaminase
VHTGAVPSLAEHPIGLLRRLRFRVTVSTDNRLMSGISLSSELAGLVETFGWSWRDLNWLTINAMKSAFCPFEERLALIDGRIKPGFAALEAASGGLAGAGGTGPQDSLGDDALID